jgi:hypothetical protein
MVHLNIRVHPSTIMEVAKSTVSPSCTPTSARPTGLSGRLPQEHQCSDNKPVTIIKILVLTPEIPHWPEQPSTPDSIAYNKHTVSNLQELYLNLWMFEKTESRMVATYIGLNFYSLRIRWFILEKANAPPLFP